MYYFIGIKGAGMSSLAVIMKGLGYKVCGSDLEKHFFTEEELIKNNISMYPYDANNIKKDMKKYETLVKNTEGETQTVYNEIYLCIEELLEDIEFTKDNRIYYKKMIK